MSGSWRVQSALSVATPASENALRILGSLNAMRSLTLQVMHHAAVKSTNTGMPAISDALSACFTRGSVSVLDQRKDFIERTGSTHGIRLRTIPPAKANSNATTTPSRVNPAGVEE